ncbi:hypothetical protein BH24ACT22_BH24ACT22_07800 [soil metagenome]
MDCLSEPFGYSGTGVQAELFENAADVVVYGPLGDDELLGDLRISETLLYQFRDLCLAGGEGGCRQFLR